MSKKEFLELQAKAYDTYQSKQEDDGQPVPDENADLAKGQMIRSISIPTTMLLSLLFVYLTNFPGNFQWLSFAAYGFCAWRLITGFRYYADQYEWQGFDFYQTCNEYPPARIALYCVDSFVAGICMFAGAANVTIIGSTSSVGTTTELPEGRGSTVHEQSVDSAYKSPRQLLDDRSTSTSTGTGVRESDR